MVPESDNRPVPLGRIARSHVALIVGTTMVGLLLGFVVSTRLDDSASATTTVLLNPLEGNAFYPSTRGEQLVNLGTEAQALRSDAVATLVAETTGTEADPKDLLENVSVTNPSNTQILEVSYSAEEAADAATYSQAFADAFLQHRRQKADALIGGQIAQFDEQIVAIQAQLAGLAAQYAAVDEASVDAELIRQQSQTLSSQISALTARKADLESLPREPGQIITPAEADSGGPFNMKLLVILAGGLLGAAAGLAIAMARTVSDRRIHSVGDLEVLDVPVLGVFGAVDATASTAPTAVNSWGEVSRTAEEQVRRIRAALLARQRSPQAAVLITGASYSGHAPLVVAELAGSLARSGLETLVLHATLRSDEPRPLLPGRHTIGLAQLLLGRGSVSDATVRIGPMLSAIPVGELGEEVSDLLIGDAMRRLVRDLKGRCDILLIAADPIRDGTAQSLTGVVDGVVLEVDQHLSSRSEVEEAVRTLGMLSADFDGAILVGPEAEEWAQNFRPHLTMMQRELGAARQMLMPAGQTSGPSAPEGEAARDVDDGDPAPGTPTLGEPKPQQHSRPPVGDAAQNDDEEQAPEASTNEPWPNQNSSKVRVRTQPAKTTGPSHDG